MHTSCSFVRCLLTNAIPGNCICESHNGRHSLRLAASAVFSAHKLMEIACMLCKCVGRMRNLFMECCFACTIARKLMFSISLHTFIHILLATLTPSVGFFSRPLFLTMCGSDVKCTRSPEKEASETKEEKQCREE